MFDESYLDLLRSKDKATEQDFRAHFQLLLQIMLRARRVPAHAIPDVIQETFARVLEMVHADKVREPERLGGLVQGICKNILKEGGRHPEPPSLDGEPPTQPPEGCPWHGEPDDSTPESRMIQEDIRRDVQEVLEALPPSQMQLLVLIDIEEWNRKALCALLGISGGCLRIKLHRAREHFKELYNRRKGRSWGPPASGGCAGSGALIAPADLPPGSLGQPASSRPPPGLPE